ncbi:hypothetical protein STZ1_10339 [Bacillus subtilis]
MCIRKNGWSGKTCKQISRKRLSSSLFGQTNHKRVQRGVEGETIQHGVSVAGHSLLSRSISNRFSSPRTWG